VALTGEALRIARKKNSDRLKHTYHESYATTFNEASDSHELVSGESLGLNYGPVIMQGYLTKKSRWYSKLGLTSRTWQRRWFVLSETFWYCRDPATIKKVVEIPLWKAWKVVLDDKDPFEFHIYTPGQIYVLRANTKKNAEKWVAALEHRVQMTIDENPDLFTENGIAEVEPDEDEENLLAFPYDGTHKQIIMYFLQLPYALLFSFTIPDVRRENCRHMYIITFIMVLVWLGVMAYAMVFGADNFARSVCLEEDIMGLTITAMGASLPSLFSSVIAAKQGMANMAISNAFGANLCSILLALGIPMFVYSLVFGPYQCTSDAILTASFIILLALVIFIVMAAVTRFTLNKVHGVILLILYVVLLATVVVLDVLDINIIPTKETTGSSVWSSASAGPPASSSYTSTATIRPSSS